MHISDKGLKLIRHFEGCSLRPYLDPIGLLTIGVGHLITKEDANKYSIGITSQEADNLLRHDCRKAETAIGKLITIPLTQGEFDGLVSFTFNLGAGALRRSTLRMRLNRDEDRLSVADEFRKWTRAGGHVLPGLIRRREAERELFLS